MGVLARAGVLALIAGLTAAVAADAAPSRHIINGVNVLEPFSAAGSEPFWGASVSGRTVSWSDPNESNEAVKGMVGRPSLTRNRAVWTGRLDDGRSIRVILTPGPCEDLADYADPLTAEVLVGHLDGRGARGCAETDEAIRLRREREDAGGR
jgi:uncharacterized membrane protein